MRGIAAVLGASLVGAGCSFITVRGAPAQDPGYRPVPCTQSRIAPIADTIPALVLLGISAAIIADISNDDAGMEGRALAGLLVAVPFAIGGAPFALSAWYGYHRTGRCRDLNQAPLAPVSPSGPPGA